MKKDYLLWVRNNSGNWFTLIQGDYETVSQAISKLTLDYPHLSYQVQTVEHGDYTVFRENR